MCDRPLRVTPPFGYRTFKQFDTNAFLFDLSCAPSSEVYNNDPGGAIYVIMPIIDKHAPSSSSHHGSPSRILRKKRVKYAKLPPWLTKDVIEAMAIRDRLKKGKQFEDFKKQQKQSQDRTAKESPLG